MCHHGYEPTNWRKDVESDQEDEESEPSFLNDESDADVELLTDGGD